MFPNSNQNNKKPQSVNTNGRRLTNDSGENASMVDLGFWGGYATLRFHPALPLEQRSETKKWDLDNYLQATVSAENAETIVAGITKRIEPAIKEGQEDQINVIIGGDSVLQISVENQGDTQRAFVSIFKSLNPDNKRPEKMFRHELSPGRELVKYDFESGEFQLGSGAGYPGLGILKWHLIGLLVGGSHALVHAHRVVDKAFREKVLTGVGQPTGGGSNNYNRSNNNVFGGGGSNEQPQQQSSNPFGVDPVNTDELNKMMDM